MSEMKTAYELACERFIAPKYPREPEKDANALDFDFIELDDFDNVEGEKSKPQDVPMANEYLQDVQNIYDYVDMELEKIKAQDPDNGKTKGDPDDLEGFKIQVNQPVEQKAETIVYDSTPLQVHWYGHFMGYTGFSRLNRAMLFGLNKLGVQVKPDIEPYLDHVNDETRRTIEKMARIDIPNNALKIYGTTVPADYRHPGKRVVYTMMETSKGAHKDYIQKLNMMGETWVPTNYGKEILKSSGVQVPIKVMPLGVDTQRYKPMAKKIDFGFDMNGFKFVSVFRWSYRKGFDVLLRSYMEEFSSDEDVSLLIVARIMDKPEEVGSQQIIDDFNGIKSGIGKPDDGLPHVVLYDKPIGEKYMPRLYNTCHSFVMISRGEGFGLPYIEAAACGLPVIASNCSGQTEFLNENNSYLVDPDGYVEANTNGQLARMAKMCHFYQDQEFPNFSGQAIQKTRDHMRHVFENYQEAREKNQVLMKDINDNYTWDKSVERVYDRIQQIG